MDHYANDCSNKKSSKDDNISKVQQARAERRSTFPEANFRNDSEATSDSENRAVNQQNLSTYGAYNVHLELTDSNGIRRETLRPYLAIDRDKDDTQILLGMPALEKMKIKVDCEKHEWQYKLSKNGIRAVRKSFESTLERPEFML